MFDNDEFYNLNNQSNNSNNNNNNNNNYNNINHNREKRDEFKSMRSKIYTYAGEPITETSYKVLVDIIGNPFSITGAFAVITNEISYLKSIGIDIDLKKIISPDDFNLNIIQCLTKGNISENILNKNQEFAQKFESIISQIEDDLRENDNNKFEYSSEYSYEESESKYEAVEHVLTILAIIRYKISFYLSHKDAYCTNISGIISSIELPSDEMIDIVKKIHEMSPEEKNEYFQKNAEHLREIFMIQEEYVKNYTSLSPHFISSLISSLDIIRANFFTHVHAKTISQDVIISNLKNYEDSLLSYLTDSDSIKIEQDPEDGQKILISWDTPAIFASQIIKEQETLKSELIPIKTLLNELGGDLTCEIDRHEIIISITCPEQEAPTQDLFDTIPDNLIFTYARCCAVIKPAITPIKFAIPFKLVIGKDSLKNSKDREGLASLLSNISKFNSNESIESISLQKSPINDDSFMTVVRYQSNTINGKKEVNISDKDISLFAIMSEHLLDSQVIDYLYNITTIAKCNELNLITDSLESTKDIMNAMIKAIHKAQNITNGNLYISLKNGAAHKLKISDSDGNTIISAIYQDKFKCFCGRCHDPKLTKITLDIFDKIVGYDGEKVNIGYELGEDFDFIKNLFLRTMHSGVLPSINFIKTFASQLNFRLALSKIPILEQIQNVMNSTNDIKSPQEIYRMIRDDIEHGMITIKQDEFDFIKIDAPSASKNHEFISNNTNVIIINNPLLEEKEDTEEIDKFFEENKIE